ncbi:polysaccharide deacetylase family protein [Arthrobacter sp. M-10]|uniref:polysaccharide deacetylase family protein n=1 Tax=Arthrobacter sp. M-10 TaxID=3233037 RepID=UPI003F9101BD
MSARRLSKRTVPVSVRAHWFILLAVLLALGVALVVQGYMHHLAGIADDSVPGGGSASTVPDAVSHGGPVVDSRGGSVRTVGPPDRTLALTFDDGPDPVWTPRILDVLRKHHVHATFFVVGSAAIDNPDLVRRILADGNEIGVHTLTHADLGSAPAWRQQLEVQGDQQVIAGITGRASTLLRPPYSSENDAVRDGTWAAMRTAADRGYLTVLTTQDSEDWQRPGVAAIEKNLTPSGPQGQVLSCTTAAETGSRRSRRSTPSSPRSRIKASGSRRRATPSGSQACAMPRWESRSAETRWCGEYGSAISSSPPSPGRSLRPES